METNQKQLPTQKQENMKLKYASAAALIAGPLLFTIGALTYGYNKISAMNTAQSEWGRYKKERNNYLDVKRSQLNAQIYKTSLERDKDLELAKKVEAYFSELPAVMRSSNGMTLVNFGRIINGEEAQYSYQTTVGQKTYSVQGTIKSDGNNLIFEDDYGKTNSDVLSAGEVRHEKNEANQTIGIQLITTRNKGNLAELGQIKTFTFNYN